MPQLTEYPYLPEADPARAVSALIEVCRGVPADGESWRSMRTRLRDADLWERDRVRGFQRFFRLPGGAELRPSALMRKIADASPDDARRLLADRMWEANPVLFKTVIDRLSERVSPPEELYGYVDSFAYRGQPIPRPELISWVVMARGVELIHRVGIALGAGELADEFDDRLRKLDLDEYLEEDEPEPEPDPVVLSAAGRADARAEDAGAAAPKSSSGSPAPAIAGAHPRARASAAIEQAARARGNPRGEGVPVPASSIRAAGRFDGEVLADTSARLASWWSAADAEAGSLGAADFGIDAERWMEGSEEAVYRLAVAAAFAFRLEGDAASVRAAYAALEKARVLDDLYYGTAPDELPAGVDSRALMLASLVARRCAEAPDLAATLEKQKSAAAAFAELERGLGRGLFRIELFWLMRALGEIGAVRWDDLGDYSSLPTRLVRDTLFRLGYLETPYAQELDGLVAAAAAARRAAGDAGRADEVLAAFAVAAGCAYDCPNRRRCEFACRERL